MDHFGWLKVSRLGVIALTLIFLPSGLRADDRYQAAREQLVQQRIATAGVTDPKVLKSIRTTPRHEFVPENQRERAYLDMSLPIGNSQTISSPFIVALMTEALQPQETDKVLEIGTGSGYQTALLARSAKKVFSVDRYQSLIDAAKDRLDKLGLSNVTFAKADGVANPVGQGLYDRIIIDSSFDSMPRFLLEQLVSGGIVVTILGPANGEQMAVKLTKIGSRFDRVDLNLKIRQSADLFHSRR